MKSKFGQKFNHDPIAQDYDFDVGNEDNPIRNGYGELMEWLKAKTGKSSVVIDLGCGTGNTALSIKSYEKIYCIDISQNMLNIARNKFKDNRKIVFIKSDLLNFFTGRKNTEPVDTIVSTYAIHHLTQAEKHKLFKKIFDFLPKGGKIVFGDLMFKNIEYETEMKKKHPDLVEEFDDEFYWYIDDEVAELKAIGFNISIKQFSDLSWGIFGRK